MSNIAIILARGGSKRLPRKNILPFHGKPLMAWSIEAALESGLFQRVLVSTDDPEIADIARQYGADVPFLRQAAADDLASSSEATHAALLQAQAHWGCAFDRVAQLMANCPLRGASDIREAMAQFESRAVPSQISCFKFGWMNPWWAMTLSPEGTPGYIHPQALSSRSQDLPDLYCPTGALWLARGVEFTEHRTFYMPGHTFYPMDWRAALDIDDEADFQMAQAVFHMRSGLKGTCSDN